MTTDYPGVVHGEFFAALTEVALAAVADESDPAIVVDGQRTMKRTPSCATDHHRGWAQAMRRLDDEEWLPQSL